MSAPLISLGAIFCVMFVLWLLFRRSGDSTTSQQEQYVGGSLLDDQGASAQERDDRALGVALLGSAATMGFMDSWQDSESVSLSADRDEWE